MKLFGVNFGSEGNFKITDADREWVESNFKWLIEVFGYPNKELHHQVLLNAANFPKTFSTKEIEIGFILDDLSNILHLDRTKISFVVQEDLRDTPNMPYASLDHAFECELEVDNGRYRIFIAKQLVNRTPRLIHCLTFQFIKISLVESALEFDVGGDDTDLFVYLAGVFYGFGIILSKNLDDYVHEHRGQWEIKWHAQSIMPLPVMAFSLATYANIMGEDQPEWRKELGNDMGTAFDAAAALIRQYPNDIFNASELKAAELFNLSNNQFNDNDLDAAIATLQKILFLTDDDILKADVYNNMGYYFSRKQEYDKAISAFRNALAIGPEYGYANDNLGYTLIVTGNPEEGKKYIDKAIQTGNNDLAYSFRNLALYYAKTNDPLAAASYFEKAFNENTPVELLEYHYAIFLKEQGQHEKALMYLQLSIDKNEHEGNALLKEWHRSSDIGH
jgi:tetratricopeptide (TPR) repeat protein